MREGADVGEAWLEGCVRASRRVRGEGGRVGEGGDRRERLQGVWSARKGGPRVAGCVIGI